MFNRQILAAAILVVAFAHGETANAQISKRGLAAQKAVAERAWPSFFKSFRAAVARRDREALKRLMVRDFFFSGGGGDDNHDGDTRDDAFRYWDDPQVHGWQAFDKALAKGAVPSEPNTNGDGGKYLSRVAPPTGRNTTNLDKAPPWIAFFEFRNSHWYCTSFSECCD